MALKNTDLEIRQSAWTNSGSVQSQARELSFLKHCFSPVKWKHYSYSTAVKLRNAQGVSLADDWCSVKDI